MLESRSQTDSWKRALRAFVATLVAFSALYCGYLFFTTLRALAARTTSLPFVDNMAGPSTVQGRAPEQELPDIGEKKERINVLLLGIDHRTSDANDTGPWRTDTMILVSIDPATNSMSMLSIPRDLWVTIPGYGESRINMAHYLGDLNDYPGGGVALAKKTVQNALGVPVHYYGRIDFSGFEQMIDAIDGVTINVEQPIHDEEYPDGNYGTIVLDIPAGLQHMNGELALQYARSRHGTGDYDRMTRQQNVLLAVRDKALSLNIPLSRIPKLLALAGDSILTDLTVDEIIALAKVVQQVDRSKIKYGLIDDSMTETTRTPKGWLVEVADWDKVQQLVDELFPVPVPSVVPSPSLAQGQLSEEGVRIEVLNGTLTAGLAEETAQLLLGEGFRVLSYDNADRFDHEYTLIINYGNAPYTVEALAAQLDVSPDHIYSEEDGPEGVDVVVILGRDYAQRAEEP